jgi:ATP phosphoribosyltransferase
LVVNKASMKTKHQRIQTFIEQIRAAVREQNNG